MPTKRKANPTSHTKPPAASSDTIFFYMPGEKPYGIFCQWHTSPITIPTTSLSFLIETTPPTSTNEPSISNTTIVNDYAPKLTFTCAEQFYMFCKALYFSDATSCSRILATTSPKEQKKLGQSVKHFNDDKWSLVKYRVAQVGNWYKFSNPANKYMREVLFGTGEQELAEAARRDRVWGIGYNAQEAERYRPMWGQNLLGKALMCVRARIREWVRRESEWEVVAWEWDGGDEEEEDRTQVGVVGEGSEEVMR